MLLTAVAALDALFYLSQLPLCVAFRATWRGGLRFGAGVAPVDARAAMARAEKAMAARGKPGGRRSDRRFALRLLRRIPVDAAAVRGRLSLGDAAATALACGSLQRLGQGLRRAVPALECRVEPDFETDSVSFEARGMFVVRAGHIIAAAAGLALDASVRRMKAWTSARSKI